MREIKESKLRRCGHVLRWRKITWLPRSFASTWYQRGQQKFATSEAKQLKARCWIMGWIRFCLKKGWEENKNVQSLIRMDSLGFQQWWQGQWWGSFSPYSRRPSHPLLPLSYPEHSRGPRNRFKTFKYVARSQLKFPYYTCTSDRKFVYRCTLALSGTGNRKCL